MKKLALFIMLFFMASILWAMPPMPGSGHTHDGSLRWETEEESSGLYAASLSSRSSSGSSSADCSALVKSIAATSSVGSKKILVILAEFQNLKFNDPYFDGGAAKTAQTHDDSYYTKLLESGPGLTMRNYYLNQSQNKLSLSFQVLGGPGTLYTSANNYEYYGANDIAENDVHPAELVREMLVKASGAVDSDVDNCTVIIIHAGPGEETTGVNSNCIWSHKNSLSAQGLEPVTINGKKFNNYIIAPEYYAYNGIYEATVGVFCHEFGHILGLQDAYDTTYWTSGVGQWSLMGGGSWGTVGKAGSASGADPAPLMAWERLALGWIDEVQITEEKTYEFSEMNKEDKVYTMMLADNQFLLFEGKAKNMTGIGMCVPENGLLITQLHKEVLSTYWSKNRINSSAARPHGVMVVEAVAANYKTNGLGNLWQRDSTANRFTTTALFRSGTLTSVGPSTGTKKAALPLLPLFIDTIIASGVVIGMLAAWYVGRRKLCAVIAVAVTAAFISMSCVVETGGGGGTYDTGPNTNYYTSTYEVHSKTGISGITINNIKCYTDGSGSFSIRKK